MVGESLRMISVTALRSRQKGNAILTLGEHSVKNIARPVRVFRVMSDMVGGAELVPPAEATAPSQETAAREADEVEVA